MNEPYEHEGGNFHLETFLDELIGLVQRVGARVVKIGLVPRWVRRQARKDEGGRNVQRRPRRVRS